MMYPHSEGMGTCYANYPKLSEESKVSHTYYKSFYKLPAEPPGA